MEEHQHTGTGSEGTSADPNPVLQVLFPMGGLGSRFAQVGIPTPKPLIPLARDRTEQYPEGLPMILRALQSFDRLRANRPLRLIFVVRVEHAGLQEAISEVCPGALFAHLDHDTRGAVETCLVAESLLDPSLPLVVMDCDLYFQSKAYEGAIVSLRQDRYAGLLLYFQSKAPRYSYAELVQSQNDSQPSAEGRTSEIPAMEVVRTAEKVPISPNALIGAYGFADGATFVRAAHQLMLQQLSGGDPNPTSRTSATAPKEFYLSLLYNILLKDGLKVRAVEQEEYHSFGTPDEMAKYNRNERSYMLE